MKFEYEEKRDDRECVAYIDDEGDLIIKDTINHVNEHPILMRSGDVGMNDGFRLDTATHKFYPGDKITITF